MRRLSLLPLLVACASHRAESPAPANTASPGEPAPEADAPPADHGQHGAHRAEHHAGHGQHGAHPPEQHGEHHGADAAGHQHRFEDPAAYAAMWESPERDAWQEPAKLVAAMEIEPGMRVADIGAGTGYLLPYLTGAVGPEGTVFAVDLEPAMLKWMGERAAKEGWTQVKTVPATPTSPGLAAGSVDRAVMINVWHHIEDRVSYGRAVGEALAEGGRFYVVETRMDAPEGPPVHLRMPPDAVIAELEQAGLRAELHPWENTRQYMVVARR